MFGSQMACSAIHSWSLCSLVGAYLDLALVYLLLCGATIAYLTAKFLSIFGLALPCSCNSFSIHPHRPHPCLQLLLVDHPTAKIAAVHSSLRTRFPFDSRCGCSVGDDGGGGGGDESCGSVSNNPKNLSLPSPLPVDERAGPELVSSSGRAPDFKGKGVLLAQRPPPAGLRRRRRRRPPISSSSLHLQLGWQGEGTSPTPFNLSRVQRGISEESSAPADSGPLVFHSNTSDDRNGLVEGAAHGPDEIIRDLERAFEEEQAARAALYLELEKERSAAGSAADEAMAMILRLQKERADVEMEARQYRRMIEEKSAYDEEEMEILKEIILMREREKRVLEEEVESYRQMMHSGRVGGFDKESPSLVLAEDTGSSSHGDVKKDHLEVTDSGYESNPEFQEKGMVTMEVYPSSVQSQRSVYGEHSIVNMSQNNGFHEETSHSGNEEEVARESKSETRVAFEDSSHFEAESSVPRVHDVHVVHDGLNLGPVSSWAGVEQNIRRSCSDMTRGQPMDNLCDKSFLLELKRSSMSAVEIERFKLETEVELLRRRLKIIQQGREKLSFSVERMEKDSFQLQLLDEIACQLQEIRKITEPERNIRQASLPPPSSEVNSKKRRCRSVSWGVKGSA